MDTFTQTKRRQIMRAIKSKNTKPELMLRKMIYGLGFRYRIHVRELAGSPDIVFLKRRKVIFVHGCFWHRHDCKRGKWIPASNNEYWLKKFELNCKRDCEQEKTLVQNGWEVLVIWECETTANNLGSLELKIKNFLIA